ncbi:MAG: hypothetical protein P8Z81_13120 [Deinococcales bacterium]
MPRVRRIAPYAFLLLAPAILVELLSGNTPPHRLANPFLALILVVSYGLPALLIADATARWKLSWGGVIALCYAYGFYNEGVIAKTLFDGHAASAAYNGYGAFLGLGIPWMLSILTVHAFLSMLFPVVFAGELFPERMREPFLPLWTRTAFVAVLLVLGVLLFTARGSFHAPLVYLVGFLAAIAVIALGARLFTRGRGREHRCGAGHLGLAPFWWGVLAPILFLAGPSLIVNARLSVAYFVLFWLAFLAACLWLVARRYRGDLPHLVLFALGAYAGLALLGLTFSLRTHVDVVIFNAVAIATLLVIAFGYRRRRAALAAPAAP